MRLSIFAHQVMVICLDPVGSELGLSPVEGLLVKIKIIDNNNVLVNGENVGNRQAAVRKFTGLVQARLQINERLEYLRGEIEAERISTEEIVELQSLVEYIDEGDTLLLQWAGVPEFSDEDEDDLTSLSLVKTRRSRFSADPSSVPFLHQRRRSFSCL